MPFADATNKKQTKNLSFYFLRSVSVLMLESTTSSSSSTGRNNCALFLVGSGLCFSLIHLNDGMCVDHYPGFLNFHRPFASFSRLLYTLSVRKPKHSALTTGIFRGVRLNKSHLWRCSRARMYPTCMLVVPAGFVATLSVAARSHYY